MLAMCRLTEAQLRQRLAARGYADEAIAGAISSCKRDGYIDDALFASLYVEGPRKAVGDVRLVAELVRRGIDREAAQRAVSAAPRTQTERIALAFDKLRRAKRELSYQSSARALERLGFPTSLIYRVLREHAATAFGELLGTDSTGS
jgi:regulatory protein